MRVFGVCGFETLHPHFAQPNANAAAAEPGQHMEDDSISWPVEALQHTHITFAADAAGCARDNLTH